ncbi:hypothetical protein CHK_0187 [Christensenella hongkongensis]|uniref:Uncharacterized protein n=1 Tax=Christensenella hongkongensis TaxID=270498 RepID=A0A0M2NIB5_9FIRM|nr:hypothetical protein CHK_0187 [Christensenella hongkongensis]
MEVSNVPSISLKTMCRFMQSSFSCILYSVKQNGFESLYSNRYEQATE